MTVSSQLKVNSDAVLLMRVFLLRFEHWKAPNLRCVAAEFQPIYRLWSVRETELDKVRPYFHGTVNPRENSPPGNRPDRARGAGHDRGARQAGQPSDLALEETRAILKRAVPRELLLTPACVWS